MRALIILPITIALLYSPSLGAEALSKGGSLSRDTTSTEKKKWYYGFEISRLNIKQTSDGTGIIKEVECEGCDFNFVKITPKTEVKVNAIKQPLLRARERAGKEAYIEFDKDTAEVITIYWSE